MTQRLLHSTAALMIAALGCGCTDAFAVQVTLSQAVIESVEGQNGRVARGHVDLQLDGLGHSQDDPTELWLMTMQVQDLSFSGFNISVDVPNAEEEFPLDFYPNDHISVPLEIILTRTDQSWCLNPLVTLTAEVYNRNASAMHMSDFSGTPVAFSPAACP